MQNELPSTPGADMIPAEQLMATQAKWQTVANAIVDALVVIDEHGRIQEFNPALMALFGYDRDELVGQNISMLMPEPYRSEHDGYIERYRKSGEKRIIGLGRESVAMHKSGEIFPVLLSVGEARYDGSRAFVGVIYDLTEAKRNEERQVEWQKTEATTQLTAGLAHDFNNLLTVVQGNLEMLDGYVAGREGRELLGEVLEAIEEGTQLVRQLLAFSRKQPLAPELLDINLLVRNLVKLLRRTISENIEIRDILGSRLSPIQADPRQLENAILNLVLNARDAMPCGGCICIETDMVTVRNTDARSETPLSPGEYVRVMVCDTGSGIPAELVDRVFEPFFTTKEPGKGSGLGLSMVQGFTRQSGGDLLLDSTEGRGTTMSMLLPAAEGTVVGKKSADTGPYKQIRQPSEKILLVEDDVRVLRANARRLAALGYTVLTAENGKEALETLAGQKDIVLLFSDIIMPGGMLGYELAEEARAMHPDLKILLTTGYADEPALARAADYALITKPFSGSQLARRLADLLDS